MRLTAVHLDPHLPPTASPIGTVRVRERVAVAGRVTAMWLQTWAGDTPALHATLTDHSGSIELAFLGRAQVAGVETGRWMTVAGAVISHRGLPVVMNPQLWLAPVASRRDEPRAERRLTNV